MSNAVAEGARSIDGMKVATKRVPELLSAEAARQAVENDVHILGISSLAAAHLTLVPELKAELTKQGRGDIMIVVGGVVPPQDYAALKAAGAEAIFPPGTVIAEAAEELVKTLKSRLGHGREAAE